MQAHEGLLFDFGLGPQSSLSNRLGMRRLGLEAYGLYRENAQAGAFKPWRYMTGVKGVKEC